MTKWQYKVEVFRFQENDELQHHLQELGNQWWELLECWFKEEDDSFGWGVWLLLKRKDPMQQVGS